MYCFAPIGNNTEIPGQSNIVQLEYEYGDILSVHAHLLRKADQNKHPTWWRRTLYFVCIKEGERFWLGWTAKREFLDRFDSEECEK